MRVKICGITRREDARLAVELGAAALGFILWPESPRVVTVETARAIAASVPAHVERVGVFVNAGRDAIERAVDGIGLTTVQLHGDEPPGLARALLGRHAVIKAIALGDHDEDPDLAMWSGVRILLDARDPRRGGTGRAIDWGRAAAIASRREVILAGGLHPDNVAEAVRRVRPVGIDVSSGVESAPGLKDAAKLRALFDALAHVEA